MLTLIEKLKFQDRRKTSRIDEFVYNFTILLLLIDSKEED